MLGKGLESLLVEARDNFSDKDVFKEIDIKLVVPNPNQPRRIFDEESLKELSHSMKTHGQLQPIILTNNIDQFIIVAGERRYRAALMAKFETIKAVILDIPANKQREIAIIENIQREDLNPLELANCYHELTKEHNITHQELSVMLKKSRTNITNVMRLLSLSPFAKEQIANSRLSLGHAKILASLSQDEQDDMVRKILNESLNVRETQSLTQKKSNNIKPSNGFKIESVAKNSIKNYFKNRDINVLVSNNKITFDIKNEESIKKFMNFFID